MDKFCLSKTVGCKNSVFWSKFIKIYAKTLQDDMHRRKRLLHIESVTLHMGFIGEHTKTGLGSTWKSCSGWYHWIYIETLETRWSNRWCYNFLMMSGFKETYTAKFYWVTHVHSLRPLLKKSGTRGKHKGLRPGIWHFTLNSHTRSEKPVDFE